jgi:hypothetical protein
VRLGYHRAVPVTLDSKMTRSDVVATVERQGEVEGLAQAMLVQSVSITPYHLAERAQINWFAARDVLQAPAKRGHAKVLANGRFGRPPQAPTPRSGESG